MPRWRGFFWSPPVFCFSLFLCGLRRVCARCEGGTTGTEGFLRSSPSPLLLSFSLRVAPRLRLLRGRNHRDGGVSFGLPPAFCFSFFLCVVHRICARCEGGTTGTEGPLKRLRAKGGGPPPSLRFLPRAPSSLLFLPHAPFYLVVKGVASFFFLLKVQAAKRRVLCSVFPFI